MRTPHEYLKYNTLDNTMPQFNLSKKEMFCHLIAWLGAPIPSEDSTDWVYTVETQKD